MDKIKIVLSLLYCISVFVLLLIGNTASSLLLSILVCMVMLSYTAYLGYLLYASIVFSAAISNPSNGLFSSLLFTTPFIYLYKDRIKKIAKENVAFLISLACLFLFKFRLSYAVIPLAIVFYYKKFDSRIFVATAIILLVSSAYTLAFSNGNLANSLAIMAYYFLVLGVFGSFLEYLRECKSNNDAVDKGVDNHGCS